MRGCVCNSEGKGSTKGRVGSDDGALYGGGDGVLQKRENALDPRGDGGWGGVDLHGGIEEVEDGTANGGGGVHLELQDLWDELRDEGSGVATDHDLL